MQNKIHGLAEKCDVRLEDIGSDLCVKKENNGWKKEMLTFLGQIGQKIGEMLNMVGGCYEEEGKIDT